MPDALTDLRWPIEPGEQGRQLSWQSKAKALQTLIKDAVSTLSKGTPFEIRQDLPPKNRACWYHYTGIPESPIFLCSLGRGRPVPDMGYMLVGRLVAGGRE